MKKQQWSVSIHNPCQQDWNTMITITDGKFCNHCAKSVTDLTKLSDAEIISLLKKTSGSMCGRLQSSQVNRKLIQHPSQATILYKLLTALLLSSASGNAIAAEPQNANSTYSDKRDIQKPVNNPISLNAKPGPDSLKNVLRGKVLDSATLEPMAFANIFIKSAGIGTATDIDGNFTFIIPEELLTDPIIVSISYMGIEKQEVIHPKELPLTRNFFISMYEGGLIGIICVPDQKKWWQFWK